MIADSIYHHSRTNSETNDIIWTEEKRNTSRKKQEEHTNPMSPFLPSKREMFPPVHAFGDESKEVVD